MQRLTKIIDECMGVPFGFCPFSAVGDNLLECRAKARLPKDAKTIICFTFPYKVTEENPKNISRYAAVPDYHEVCGKMLSALSERLRAETGYEFEYFIDNSPIPEVYAAARAGLGVVGKNGLLITERFGSFVFIGEIVTNMEIACGEEPKSCADCGACLAACPVALCKEGCLSAVTQKKKDLTEEEARLIRANGSVWGCDICQNACPLNKGKEQSKIPEFINGYRPEYQKGESIEGRAYAWRGEGVIARNLLLFEDPLNIIAGD